MTFAARLPALLLASLGLVWSASAQQRPTGPVEVTLLTAENWERFAPEGKEVDAIYGDLVLRNRHLTAVIAAPLQTRHANMTVRDVGGCLIDLTERGFESDQLSCFYPGRRYHPYRSWSVLDENGADHDVSQSFAYSRQSAGITVTSPATETRPEVRTTYELQADAPVLKITTRYVNTGEKPLNVELIDDLRADGGKEDMLKAPNGSGERFWFDDRYWQQAYGITAAQRAMQFESESRTSTLKYVDGAGRSTVKLEPGADVTLVRHIAPGRTRLHVSAAFDAVAGRKRVSTTLIIRDRTGRLIPAARVELSTGGQPIGTAVCLDGRTTIPLRPGTYAVKVRANGIVVSESSPLRVQDATAQEETITADGYHPGTLLAGITDETGRGIPCKIELVGQGETPNPDFGPETATYAVRNLRYAPHGEFTQDLFPGTYDVRIGHGPEYDAIFTRVEIKPGQETELTGRLIRSVDTTGWVSSDFHSHSSPSGDNTGSQFGRVLNLVCEHIEFAPCTEHNRISTYVPHIEQLQIAPFIATCSGMELTGKPLPLNHQNAFPLHYHPHTQDGGAPVTDVDPERQMERLALWDNRSDKLVQQNHPDIGWLFFDRDGDGQHDEGYFRSFGLIDVMEVHPIDSMLHREPIAFLGDRGFNNRMFNWLQLLNLGHRIPGVVNTDAHYNFHGSGWLRNWIQSPTDDPAQIDTMDMVHAAEEGRLIMSNGPFLKVSATSANSPQPVTAGMDLAASDGKLQLHVRVQCANWLDINRVFVLVNGRMHPEHNYRRDTHPDLFSDDVVKFDRVLPISLDADAHLVVVTGHDGRVLGPVAGPELGSLRKPTAVANPIFVDVDGGGFRPNKDTLDHPLPTKYE